MSEAARLEKSGIGKISLDHVIKERYPTFTDALRDLDDALSMLFLFANLPSTTSVPPKTVARCQQLCHEFQHYVIVSHSLRKSFLSIKGIYYQARIQGEDIMWLAPYRFVQRMTGDVDFRIMGTFVDFYTSLLGFVNFRLYSTIGLVYPPKFDLESDAKSGELGAFRLENKVVGGQATIQAAAQQSSLEASAPRADLQKQVDKIISKITAEPVESVEPTESEEAPLDQDLVEKDATEVLDDFQAAGEGADILPQPQISSFEAAALFAPFTFWLSRETPRQPLEFILRAFGCKKIAWDAASGDGAFTNNEADPSITHQIVDRPSLTIAPHNSDDSASADSTKIRPGYRVPGRIYIQPQWVWDCINQGKLLRADLYAPDAVLPPHLSPWVKPKKGAYDPSLPLEEQEKEGEAEEFEEEEAEAAAAIRDVDTKKSLSTNGHSVDDDDIMESGDELASNDDDEDDEDEEEGEEEEADLDDDDEEDNGDEIDQYQAELAAEAAGVPYDAATGRKGTQSSLRSILKPSAPSNDARKKASRRRQAEEDELQRQLGMMSRKKRQAMEKMLASQSKEETEAALLRKKRRRLEKEQINPRV